MQTQRVPGATSCTLFIALPHAKGFLSSYKLFSNQRRAKLPVCLPFKANKYLWTSHAGTLRAKAREPRENCNLGTQVSYEVCSVHQLNQNHIAPGQQLCAWPLTCFVKPGMPDFYHTCGAPPAAQTSSISISITWKLLKIKLSPPLPSPLKLRLKDQNLSRQSPSVCVFIHPPVKPNVCQRLRTITLIVMLLIIKIEIQLKKKHTSLWNQIKAVEKVWVWKRVSPGQR